ncbi:DUF2834 domain-containing protein [Aquipuribacter hungaricus]|uniref:DUF2834 domain-containing protein n=1 Tax=Aquipuribacter hungaricus TaxID=545624 RepID=A0ABV7WIA2_9MICO
MRLVYLALAVLGAAGTWFFNVRSMSAGEDYVAGWFASAASSSAAVDVLVVAVVACLFMVLEGRRTGMSRWVWALVPLSFAVAVAFTFPLFLAWREQHLRRTTTTAPGTRAPEAVPA